MIESTLLEIFDFKINIRIKTKYERLALDNYKNESLLKVKKEIIYERIAC